MITYLALIGRQYVYMQNKKTGEREMGRGEESEEKRKKDRQTDRQIRKGNFKLEQQQQLLQHQKPNKKDIRKTKKKHKRNRNRRINNKIKGGDTYVTGVCTQTQKLRYRELAWGRGRVQHRRGEK